MQLKPLKEMLSLSKEKLAEFLAPARARQVRAKAELEMAKLEETLITAESQVTELCASKDIDFGRLIDKLDEMALTERRIARYKEVLAQLFPEG